MQNTFLAANTQCGFYSLFSQMTQKTDHNILLIKGGPGTGKSSMMKKIAQAADQKGYAVEQMHCSSDPDSLDGVWVKDKKLILLDATDPKYPGAVEQILPLGELWDRDQLIPHREQIMALSGSISGLFASVYKLLGAAGEVQGMARRILTKAFNETKARSSLIKFFRQQAILPLGKKGQVQKRFISALSAKGDILYEDILEGYERVLMIEDSNEGSHLITRIADKMLADMGYDRIQLVSPLFPEHIDHLLLPECSLAILTQSARLRWQSQLPIIKTLHLKALLSSEIISENKNKLSFVRKMTKALYQEVSEHLESEKALHDELEQFYIRAMDFEALERKTQGLIRQYL